METKVVEYRLSELLARGPERKSEEESVAYGDWKKLEVIAANPFLHGEDIVARAVVYADGEPAAAEYRWPVDIEVNGKILRAESGGESYSLEKYRKDSVGLELWMRPLSPPNYLSAGCGMSQIAQKILTRLGRTMFYVPRRIGLFKSRSVVETRVNGVASKMVSTFADLGLSVWWWIVQCLCWLHMRGMSVVEVKAGDECRLGKVVDIISHDKHPFREVHDLEWVRWHLQHAMHRGCPARLYAWEKDGAVIGFCMLKKKFYEQASTRGFQNVWLGSVIEWGTVSSVSDFEKWIVLQGALMLKRMGCDAAEVVTDDVNMGLLLRKLLFVRVGDGNFGFTVGQRSPLRSEAGWDCQENWRFRPAMCDNGIG